MVYIDYGNIVSLWHCRFRDLKFDVTVCFVQFLIGLMMIWLSVFILDMYDDLLGLQVVQFYKRFILTSCIYGLDMSCLCPLIFHYWYRFRLVAWIWVVYALSHMILSSCRRHEMLLPGTVMVKDCGWLCWQVGHIESQMLSSWMWSWCHGFWHDMIGYTGTSLMFISLDFLI